MSTSAPTAAAAPRGRRSSSLPVRRIVGIAALVVLVVAMALGTKVVPKNSRLGLGPAPFNATTYGKKQFPLQQKYISGKAVDAKTLAAAFAASPTAAAKKYGVPNNAGAGPEISVKFTGVVGKYVANEYTPVKVAGLPSKQVVSIQLGPAINGTDLRDASGKIQLGDFENQIAYQNAGSALNTQLKALLTKIDATHLTGKTVTVAGVFQLITPTNWAVTPATLTVGK